MSLPASAGARLRHALASCKPLQIAGTINAYTAIQAEKLGFRAIYCSGGGVALASLGMPDLGVSTLPDVVEDVRRITRNCAVPLLVDVDTGFGNGLSITRTIKDVEAAGAAAVHIEDQILSKRCGHRPNKQVVTTSEMTARLKMAVAGRTDPSFMIMARTDALANEGLSAVISRCEAYVKAGADALFPEALTELEQYRAISEALPGVPILANMTEFGKTALFHKDELASVGVSMVLYPLSGFRAQSRAAEQVLKAILETGSNKDAVQHMHTREQTYSVIGYHKYEKQLDDALLADVGVGHASGIPTDR